MRWRRRDRMIQIKNASETVILYEAFDKWGDGINVAFADGHVEFVKDQYRHCKPLLVFGAESPVLAKAGIAPDADDPGLVVGDDQGGSSAVTSFIEALGRHRAFERETCEQTLRPRPR